jgi:hypothetical protein
VKLAEGTYKVSLAEKTFVVDEDGDLVYQTDEGLRGYISTEFLLRVGLRFTRVQRPEEDPPGTIREYSHLRGNHKAIKDTTGVWHALDGYGPLSSLTAENSKVVTR